MDKDFDKHAKKSLNYISEYLENKDLDGSLDIDFNTEILKIETPKGIYIINKHSAAKQIWLASPLSGPYHFSYIENKWVNKDNHDLYLLLNEELKDFIDIKLAYE